MNKIYKAKNNYYAQENSILDTIELNNLVSNYSIDRAWIHTGGWQSWNPGFEIEPDRKQPNLSSIIKGWDQYLIFPETKIKPSKTIVLAPFFTYLKWDNFYLVLCSTGNINNSLPPVQFILNRKNATIQIEIADKDHNWKQNDLQAEINIFTADSYFKVRDELKAIFTGEHLNQIKELGTNPCGWESWYNHYTDINQTLIYEDLNALSTKDNVINKGKFSSTIFQIDDGWEKQLGNWEWDTQKFSDDPKEITKKIEDKKYIPGLWIAPFIVDSRSPVAKEHPDWLLKNTKGQLIKAGYNPKWGEKGYFYTFDLSKDEVLEWIDSNIEKAVNKWGFRYLKFDFLYAGMIYGNYFNKDASFVWFNKALEKITTRKINAEGKSVFYLGCGLPFEQGFKYLPLSRIGCDTYEHWENKLMKFINWNGRNSAYLNVKDTLGHSLWNNIIFANDPDVIFIRDKNCTLTNEQKLLIGTVNTIFGSQFMYSDDPAEEITENEKELTDKILEIQDKYRNEEFGHTYLGSDNYSVFSKSQKYIFRINLNKGIMEE